MSETNSLAVIGGGVAGLVAAHLLQQSHSVDLYEASPRLGGHSNTFVVSEGPDQGLAVDTGFIVFNGDTYPLFQRFLRELEVPWQLSDMSFGYHCQQSGWAYGGHNLATFLASPRWWFHPDFWRFALDIARFNRRSLAQLARGFPRVSLRDYLRGYSGSFVRHYICPLGAAIWSSPLEDILDFPAETFVRFFANHGLLRMTQRPDWFTVSGGSRSYLEAFQRRFQGNIFTGCPVTQVRHHPLGVEVSSAQGLRRYRGAVLASHADQALAILAQPSPLEQELLGAWRYLANRAVLHRDLQVLPANPKVRASWNYQRALQDFGLPTLTYDMNRLQSLASRLPYLVTLNPQQTLAPELILGEWTYHHPQYDRAALDSQAQLEQLNSGPLAYCGSYHGYGFHEDAVRSAVKAAAHFGRAW